MFSITRPDPKDVAEIVAGIIAATGREVTVTYSLSLIPCPTCDGEDPLCPECKGNGTIYAPETQTVVGVVRWASAEKKRFRPEGQYIEGDCTVVVPYTAEMQQQLSRAIYVTVDGRRLVVYKITPGGYDLNRIYIVLKEDEPAQTRIG